MTPSARTFSGVNSKYFQGSIQPWSKGSSEPGFSTLIKKPYQPNYHRNKTLLPHLFQTSTIPVPHQHHTSSIPVQTLIGKGTDEFMSALELADLCGLRNIRNFRKYYLNPAIADGAIERLYPDKPNHPKQKYRLTEAAKAWKYSQISNRQPDGKG